MEVFTLADGKSPTAFLPLLLGWFPLLHVGGSSSGHRWFLPLHVVIALLLETWGSSGALWRLLWCGSVFLDCEFQLPWWPSSSSAISCPRGEPQASLGIPLLTTNPLPRPGRKLGAPRPSCICFLSPRGHCPSLLSVHCFTHVVQF